MWRISLLGGLAVVSPSGEEIRLDRLKVAELLAFLALRRTPVVDRETVVAALWPEAEIEVGRNRLKTTLALLRKDVPQIPVVSHGKNALELVRAQVEIDTETVDARLKWLQALSSRDRALASRQLSEIVSRGLLPELKTAWLFPEQARIEELVQRLRIESASSVVDSPPSFRFGDRLAGVRVPLTGRESEMAFIGSWLGESAHRTLVLVGPPGVGKTRLLVEAVSPEQIGSDALIVLSTVQASEAPWTERIGQAIGVTAGRQVTESLVKLLRGFERPLIAIDDFDQADAAMREWVLNICSLVPDLRVIATARSRSVGLSAEFLEILPLETGPTNAAAARDLLMRFAVHCGLSEEELEPNRETLESIARELDGLPLALEVAAGWLPYLKPERLLSKLRESVNFVIDRRSDDHDSLRECVRAICQSLPEGERAALRALSVCRGGCGEELAEQMFGGDWALLVRNLRERSLTSRVEGRRGNRFVSLQAIRLSVTSSESPEAMSKVLDLHQESCLKLAERAAWETSEGDRADWLNFIRDEGDNLLHAFTRSLDDPAMLDRVARLVHTLRAPFSIVGRASEFSKTRDFVLDLAAARYPAGSWKTPALVLRHRVRELWDANERDAALAMATDHRQSSELSNESRFEVAEAYDFEGDFFRRMKNYEAAHDRATEAQRLYREAGYLHHALWMESKLGGIERETGRIQDAEVRSLVALQMATEIDDHNSIGMLTKHWAKKARSEGRHAEAIRLSRRSIESFVRAGESLTTFDAYLVLAACHLSAGDRKSALSALNRAREYAHLADPESGPDFSRLMDAALFGVPIDLSTIDEHGWQ